MNINLLSLSFGIIIGAISSFFYIFLSDYFFYSGKLIKNRKIIFFLDELKKLKDSFSCVYKYYFSTCQNSQTEFQKIVQDCDQISCDLDDLNDYSSKLNIKYISKNVEELIRLNRKFKNKLTNSDVRQTKCNYSDDEKIEINDIYRSITKSIYDLILKYD